MTAPAALVFYGCLAAASATGADTPPSVAGTVREASKGALAAVLITARPMEGGKSITVTSDSSGRYRLPGLEPGRYRIEAARIGYAGAVRELELVAGGIASLDLSLRPARATIEGVPSSVLLGLLPDGAHKREFILDCTGCHQFDLRTLANGERTKTREEWRARIQQMIGFGGAGSAFPVMSAERMAVATAEWLARHVGAGVPLDGLSLPSAGPPGDWGVVITEYDLPNATDLPTT